VCGILTHAAQESDEAGAQKMQSRTGGDGLRKALGTLCRWGLCLGETLAQAAAKVDGWWVRRRIPPEQSGRFYRRTVQIDVEGRQASVGGANRTLNAVGWKSSKSGKVSFRFEVEHALQASTAEQCVGWTEASDGVVGQFHSALQLGEWSQQTEALAKRSNSACD